MRKKKRCLGHWCGVMSPVIRRLEFTIPKESQADLRRLVTYYLGEEMEADRAKAKLEGRWPGWEWLPEEIKRRAERARKYPKKWRVRPMPGPPPVAPRSHPVQLRGDQAEGPEGR